MKPTSALVGCNDAVVLPQGSVKTDWEVELGVVIGTQGALCRARPMRSSTSPATASSTTSPSASTRSSAAAPGTRARAATPSARSARGWSPPTRSPTRRSSRCGSTSTASAARTAAPKTMIFGVAELVSYVSRFMTLYPGDLITTGTPPGVGLGMKPTPVYLKAGDEMQPGHRRPRRAAPEGPRLGPGADRRLMAAVTHDRRAPAMTAPGRSSASIPPTTSSSPATSSSAARALDERGRDRRRPGAAGPQGRGARDRRRRAGAALQPDHRHREAADRGRPARAHAQPRVQQLRARLRGRPAARSRRATSTRRRPSRHRARRRPRRHAQLHRHPDLGELLGDGGARDRRPLPARHPPATRSRAIPNVDGVDRADPRRRLRDRQRRRAAAGAAAHARRLRAASELRRDPGRRPRLRDQPDLRA